MPKNILIDTRQINNIVKGLAEFEKQMPAAAMSAVNRTLDHVYTRVGKLITAEYAIKSSDVKATMKKNKARKGRITAFIISRGRRLTFSRFRISTAKNGPAKVKIKKKGKFKQVNTNPKAFVQTLSGRRQVIKRLGKGRYPVEVLRSISVPQMIDSVSVSTNIQWMASKKLAERVQHEIDYRLKKVKAK